MWAQNNFANFHWWLCSTSTLDWYHIPFTSYYYTISFGIQAHWNQLMLTYEVISIVEINFYKVLHMRFSNIWTFILYLCLLSIINIYHNNCSMKHFDIIQEWSFNVEFGLYLILSSWLFLNYECCFLLLSNKCHCIVVMFYACVRQERKQLIL